MTSTARRTSSNPDLQWAGMANMIGPSFAGGFKDMAMMRDLAQQIADNPASDIPLPVLDHIEQLAGHDRPGDQASMKPACWT
jgi:hypothetical protein